MSLELGMSLGTLQHQDLRVIPLFPAACSLLSASTPHRCWERHVLAFSQRRYYHLPLAMLFSFPLSLGNTATCLNSASTTSNGIILLSKQTCGGQN